MEYSGNHIPRAGRLAHKVAGLIREQIVRSQPGDLLPPARVMTREYRCSRNTLLAALAILRRDGVVATTRGVGSFVADPYRTAGRGATGLLYYGAISTLVGTEYFREVMLGMLEEASVCQRAIQIMSANVSRAAAIRLKDIEQFALDRVDSVVAVEILNRQAVALLGQRMPTIAVDMECREPGVSSVWLDHAGSIRRLVDPLWMLGHRRIGFVGPILETTDPAHILRRSAFLAELRARGIEPRPDWLIHSHGTTHAGNNFSGPSAGAICALPRADRPTALVIAAGGNDWMMLAELVARGIRIPQDISVVAISLSSSWQDWTRQLPPHRGDQPPSVNSWPAYDPMDDRYASLRTMVPTGLRQPFRQMGQWAVREAHRRAADRQVEPDHQMFEPEFLPGNSMGPPPNA